MEVRFEGLEVSAEGRPAGRELPSIFNAYRNWVEVRHTPVVFYNDLCKLNIVVLGLSLRRGPIFEDHAVLLRKVPDSPGCAVMAGAAEASAPDAGHHHEDNNPQGPQQYH